MRKLALILIAIGLAAAWPAAARADGDENGGRAGDNAAIAINTKDGSSLFKLAFSIRRVAGDIVDNQNVAVSYSKCERCQTTAIAIQIVLVTGNPGTVTPVNVAAAVNDQCTLCETFASAYQFVVGTGGPVRFTKLGHRELIAIKRELRALRKEDLTPAELQARIKPLMERLRNVLKTQLVPVGRGGDDDDGEERGDDDEREEGDDELEENEAPTQPETVEDEGGTTTVETTPTETTTTGTTTTETTTAP